MILAVLQLVLNSVELALIIVLGWLLVHQPRPPR